MKVKSLLFGMLVCAAFSACSDDVIENGMVDNQTSTNPAFITVSFTANGTNSSRSTADDVNNNGDYDGSAEDSGHTNLGTKAENAVNSALVVIAPQEGKGNTAFAKLYTMSNNVSTEGATFDESSKVFKTPTIELSEGTFNVLVIANPIDAVINDYASVKAGSVESNVQTVRNLYSNIINGAYDASVDASDTENPFVGQLTKNGFMMANKAACEVSLAANETKEVDAIEIERVVSKITFRHKNNDIYPVNVVLGVADPKTVTVTFPADADHQNPYDLTLNEAKIGDDIIYIHFDDQKQFVAAYRKKTAADNSVTYEKDSQITSTSTYQLQYADGTVTQQTWYVKIEEYALVNLAKKVNYVRHTTMANGLQVPFGTLNGENFLWTPYWPAINEVTFDADGNFANNFTTDSYFWQTLKQVSDESKKNTTTQYYTPFDSNYIPSDDEAVSGAGNNQQHTAPLEKIGETLAYCLENTTDIEHQMHGLSTGISFKAKIYTNADGKGAVAAPYRFGKYLFANLEELKKAFPQDNKLQALTDASFKEELTAAGVSKYDGNTCYYYTTEIKHFDNQKPLELGNMEFAIMRNNIYSLAITNVRVIGDPYVDPTPSIPDEHDEAYITVQAKILPWIVRYHDIEF